MANKIKLAQMKLEEIVSKLRQVEVLMGQGMSRLDAIRQIGVVEQTYYRWRKKYGGMSADQLKELERLQKENERLWRREGLKFQRSNRRRDGLGKTMDHASVCGPSAATISGHMTSFIAGQMMAKSCGL